MILAMASVAQNVTLDSRGCGFARWPKVAFFATGPGEVLINVSWHSKFSFINGVVT